jgi:hypothetical protein
METRSGNGSVPNSPVIPSNHVTVSNEFYEFNVTEGYIKYLNNRGLLIKDFDYLKVLEME